MTKGIFDFFENEKFFAIVTYIHDIFQIFCVVFISRACLLCLVYIERGNYN